MDVLRLTDHFHLGPELGRGGFGVVYRGTARSDGEPVAIKILLEAPDEVTRGRMAREASALMDLRHPRLAGFLGIYRDPQGSLALVYQYVEGRPMEDVLKERLPGRARGLAWCRDLAEALDALHGVGVVHRDVKPGNLIVGPDDRVTLLDFGLVRDVEAGHTVTQHGLVVGTPQFMAPELLKGLRASPASDIYAFGCLVHLLAAGDIPFNEESPGALIDAHLRRDPPIFPGWAGPARAALAKDPADRPASAGDLVRALETHQPSAATIRVEPLPGAKLDPSTPKVAARGSRLPVVPFLLSLGLAVGLGFWFGASAPTPSVPPSPPATPEASEPPAPTPPPTRRPPDSYLRMMPLAGGEESMRMASGLPILLPDGRAALGLHGGRVAVADPRSGQVTLGPSLLGLPPDSKYGVQLMPGPEGTLWGLGGTGHGKDFLLHLEDPLEPPTHPPRATSRPSSGIDLASHVGGDLWITPSPGPQDSPGAPGTLWVSRGGAEPRPVELPALKFRRRVSAQFPTPEGGMVLQVADLSSRKDTLGTTLLELGPDNEPIWQMDFPGVGLAQARITLAPEGIYLVHEDRLCLLEREGLFGEVSREAIQPLTPPIPDLAAHSASRAPGGLYRSRHGVELWTVPPRQGILYGRGLFHWLRFAAPPGEVPRELTARTQHRTSDQLVIRDNTCGVHEILETGSPDLLLVSLVTAQMGGTVVVADLERGELAWEYALEHPARNETVMARAFPVLLPWPGTRGHWLLIPGSTDLTTGVLLEHYFAPDGLLGPRQPLSP